MAAAEKIKIGLSQWDQTAAEHIRPVVLPESPLGLDGLRDDVANGRAAVLAVQARGERIGTLLVRVEQGGDGKYFIIECANSHLAGVDLVKTCMPALEAWARKLGCRALDVPTHRPGLVHKMKKQDYTVVKTVLRKVLT
ncbi:hypothetical protein [Thalassospira marina]|uniref:N-acetyltransferase domain-containing protein n=1 Tax=Thalassospira marina TaxID=2048283 RepID=A0A2N3KTM7_9PROT|nr:hypothetical protein [Thalassospira marina]AUG55728.1 hypothetical protein CSC3H3_23050 [Thalassospira marina]PKR53877.1 hypothetical protein COO20_12790 [Thalassospira marina]